MVAWGPAEVSGQHMMPEPVLVVLVTTVQMQAARWHGQVMGREVAELGYAALDVGLGLHLGGQ